MQNISPHRSIFALAIGGGQRRWLSFDQNGNIGKRAREEFSRRNPDAFQESAFRRYLSEITAETIITLATAAKKMTANRVMIGAFYGYLFETPFWESAHHALQKLLVSPAVDFLCAPMSYADRKIAGADWHYMLPLESLKQHGKLYFTEYDTRTCYSRFLAECHPGFCPENEYRNPVWLGPPSEAETLENLRMNFCRQRVSGCGSWWFDMWGGWYDSPRLMQQGGIQTLGDLFLHDSHRESIAECSAWIDEQCFAMLEHAEDSACCLNGRIAIWQSVIPTDYYEIGDFSQHIKRYRTALFFVPVLTPAVSRAQEYCRTHHIPFLVFKGAKACSAAAVRKIALENGCSAIATTKIRGLCFA